MKKAMLLGGALLMPAFCAGAELEEIHKVYKAADVQGLDLGTIASDVRVVAGDRDTLELDITKSNKEYFRWDIELKGATLAVKEKEKAKRFFNKDSNRDCRVSVKLPQSLEVKLASVSGEIEAAGLARGVQARTTSGDMDITLAGGEASLVSVSGAAKVRGLTGGLTFETVSGALDAWWASYPEKALARLKSVSGDLTLTLPRAGNIDLDFNSVSGRQEADGFTLDSSAPFSIDAGTVSGDLTVKWAKR